MDKITELKKILNNSINKLNNKYIKRNRKITFEDVIYGLSLKTINHYTYDKVVFDINYKLLKDFSPSAFKKKCNILKNGDITYLNNQLLKNIYSDKNERRVIAVDGSYLKTLKKLDKDGLKYPSEKYNNYTNSIISGIYDVDKKIIINYNHSVNKNERNAFIEQLKYIRKFDTLIFDRGYYSTEMIKVLNDKHIDYVFRVKNSLNIVKFLNKNKLKEYIYIENNKLYKIVSYKIEDKIEDKIKDKTENNIEDNSNDYYLITSRIDLSIDELKDIYWKRWSIETHFREAKYTTSLGNLNCRSLDNLLKELNMHNYVYILYYYYYNITKSENEKYDLNRNIGIEIFIENTLFILIYKKKYKKEIKRIMNILPKTYKHKKKNRKFPRISKIKITEWYMRPKKIKEKIKKRKTKKCIVKLKKSKKIKEQKTKIL